ncbi:MAG: hypothetical protein Q4E22_06250 [Coriobacteriia bacterium]|nr:hypothetical protein [Coriobacteriia bacterium]
MELAQTLINVQDIDLDILRIRKQVEEMPERKALNKARAALLDLQKKTNSIVGKRKDIELDIEANEDELTQIDERIQELNALLESADARLVANLNRDLAGQEKRKEKLNFQLEGLFSELEKLSAREDKANDAMRKLKELEQKNIAAIQMQGAEYLKKLETLLEERQEEFARLDVSYQDIYEALAEKKKGIAVAQYKDGRCSICGTEFNDSQISRMKRTEELGICQSCGRILVISDEARDE